MDISIERDASGELGVRRVLVYWGTGPLIALTPDGQVTEHYTPPAAGEVVWDSGVDYETYEDEIREAAYGRGYRAGQRAARQRARTGRGAAA